MRKTTLYVDEKKGEMFFNKTSHIMFGAGLIPIIQRKMGELLGPAAKTILKRGSKESAFYEIVNLYGNLKKYLGVAPKKTVMEKFISDASEKGEGVPELIDFDRKKFFAKVRLHNSSYAIGYKKSKEAVCHVFAGYLEAAAEIVFNKKMLCTETKCIAMGHPYCEFEIRESDVYGVKKRLDFSKYKQKKSVPKKLRKLELKINNNGELFYGNKKSELFARSFLSRLQMEFEKIIGPAARTIFYNIYKKSVIENMKTLENPFFRIFSKISLSAFGKVFLKPFNKIMTKILGKLLLKLIPQKIQKECHERGVGTFEIIIKDPKKYEFSIRIYNSYNTLGYGKTDHPVCYSLSAGIAGTVTALVGKEIDCRETKCIAMGDPYCEFELYRKDKKISGVFD